MASRVAASIAVATGYGKEMIVRSGEEYERRALALASGLTYDILPPLNVDVNLPEARVQRRGKGELAQLRRKLFLSREQSPLFDTKRWVENMEKGLTEAWKQWVRGFEFEGESALSLQFGQVELADRLRLHTDAGEWGAGVEKQTGCIWVPDGDDFTNIAARKEFFG